MRRTANKLLSLLRRLFHRDPDPFAPYAGVRQPLHRGPRDRSSSVALLEPDN